MCPYMVIIGLVREGGALTILRIWSGAAVSSSVMTMESMS